MADLSGLTNIRLVAFCGNTKGYWWLAVLPLAKHAIRLSALQLVAESLLCGLVFKEMANDFTSLETLRTARRSVWMYDW